MCSHFIVGSMFLLKNESFVFWMSVHFKDMGVKFSKILKGGGGGGGGGGLQI